MKKLLFIEGNRSQISESNVKALHSKIQRYGYIKNMPIEYLDMNDTNDKIVDLTLYQIKIVRKDGKNGDPTISNYKIIREIVDINDYLSYDGVIINGQHRYIALQFLDIWEKVEFKSIKIDGMSILEYISLYNQVKPWNTKDFMSSAIPTGDKYLDYIINCQNQEIEVTFLLSIYTLDVPNITTAKIKKLQCKMIDIENTNLHLNDETQRQGDKILEILYENKFFDKDKFTSKFGQAIKKFYSECKDFDLLLKILNRIDSDIWNIHFRSFGRSFEIQGFYCALEKVRDIITKENNNSIDE